MIEISYKDTMQLEVLYVDTRSPGEFKLDHIPDAVNIPILDNEERAFIGTIYKQVDPDLAVEEGRDIYETKISQIKKELLKYKKNQLVIYCFRGGLRSKTIAELGEKIGLKVYQLKGGYKNYRKHVRHNLEKFKPNPKLIVLHGLTGCGKTDLLQKFENKLDLEGFAQHRSSVYGAIALKPNTQKMFESLLYAELRRLDNEEFLIIEGESRKIGNIIIPEFLWKAMKKGKNVKVESSMKERVNRLVSIYTSDDSSIAMTRQITESLRQKLGNKVVLELCEYLDKKDIDSFMKLLLEKYYDPLYKYSIDDLKYELTINNDDINKAAENIRLQFNNV